MIDAGPPPLPISIESTRPSGPGIKYTKSTEEAPPPNEPKHPLCLVSDGISTCGPIFITGLDQQPTGTVGKDLQARISQWGEYGNEVTNIPRYKELLAKAQAHGVNSIEINLRIFTERDLKAVDIQNLKPTGVTHLLEAYIDENTGKLTVSVTKLEWQDNRSRVFSPTPISDDEAAIATYVLTGAVDALVASDLSAFTPPKGPKKAYSTSSRTINWRSHLSDNDYAEKVANWSRNSHHPSEPPLFVTSHYPVTTSHNIDLESTEPSESAKLLRRQQLRRDRRHRPKTSLDRLKNST